MVGHPRRRKIITYLMILGNAGIVSVIALILAIVAFNRTGGQADQNAQIRDLQAKMEKIKAETSERVDKIRQETATTLERLGKAIKKEESNP